MHVQAQKSPLAILTTGYYIKQKQIAILVNNKIRLKQSRSTSSRSTINNKDNILHKEEAPLLLEAQVNNKAIYYIKQKHRLFQKHKSTTKTIYYIKQKHRLFQKHKSTTKTIYYIKQKHRLFQKHNGQPCYQYFGNQYFGPHLASYDVILNAYVVPLTRIMV